MLDQLYVYLFLPKEEIGKYESTVSAKEGYSQLEDMYQCDGMKILRLQGLVNSLKSELASVRGPTGQYNSLCYRYLSLLSLTVCVIINSSQ